MSTNIIEIVKLFLFSNKLVKKNSSLKLTLAVSGGEDSVLLLHVFSELTSELDLQLVVAHFDHNLRDNSKEDLLFVKELAHKYGLEFYSNTAEERDSSINLEQWARWQRYNFLEKIRESSNSEFIVTAHHQRDQVETLLFRLLTGRSLHSAYNIAPVDSIRKIIRPLIEIPKDQIKDYIRNNSLKYVDDYTNNDLSRTRNKIRHQLLPYLKEHYNPEIENTLFETAEMLNSHEQYFEAEAERLSAIRSFNLEQLGQINPLLAWRILRVKAISSFGEAAKKISSRAYQNILNFNETNLRGEKIIELRDNFIARISHDGEIAFEVKDNLNVDETNTYSLVLKIPGLLRHEVNENYGFSLAATILKKEDLGFDIKELAEHVVSQRDEKAEYFDVDKFKIKKELIIRDKIAGDIVDVFQRGSRKLKKLFLEKGVKLTLRNHVPIVIYNNEIIWVPGVVRSNFAPITKETEFLLELKYKTLI